MREYEIIDIRGASYGEINDIISSSCRSYTTVGYRIYIQKFFDGDIRVITLNLHTMECSVNQHVISVNKIMDNLVVCSEDLIPQIYE